MLPTITLVAEPKIVAVLVTAVIVVCHVVIYLGWRITRRYRKLPGRKSLQRRPAEKALPEEDAYPDYLRQSSAPAEKVPDGWPFDDNM